MTTQEQTPEHIPHVPVASSSQIKSVGYHAATQTLEVAFHRNGAVYRYYGVPEEVARALQNAPSAGGYLAASIKGRYSYERVMTEAEQQHLLDVLEEKGEQQ